MIRRTPITWLADDSSFADRGSFSLMNFLDWHGRGERMWADTSTTHPWHRLLQAIKQAQVARGTSGGVPEWVKAVECKRE